MMKRSGMYFYPLSFFTSTLLSTSFFLFSFFLVHGQGTGFTWVNQAGGTGSDFGNDIAIDRAGNILVTGGFRGSATFEDTVLNSVSSADIFIAKYDSEGRLLWVTQAGGEGSDTGNGITTDHEDNLLVTGDFAGTATFGDTTLTGGGIFVAHYSSSGILNWVRKSGQVIAFISTDSGFDIATDEQGNISVTGIFHGEAAFTDTSLISSGDQDIFMLTYDKEGNLLWANRAGGNAADWPGAVTVDNDGNNILSGWFEGTIDFADTSLTSTGNQDAFLVKYTPDGELVWIKQFGGEAFDRMTDVSTDSEGNVYTTGWFEDEATFGDSTLTSIGSRDVCIIKFDPDGNLVWIRQNGGFESEGGSGIAVDQSGNSITTGSFNGTADFGDTSLTSVSDSDVFVTKYDHEGNFRWVIQGGGIDPDGGRRVALNSDGSGIVVGSFSGTATFGMNDLTSMGFEDIFITKFMEGVTSIVSRTSKPESFQLYQNYPNPFNPTTRIRYTVGSERAYNHTSQQEAHYDASLQIINLSIYNSLGQKVITLVNEPQLPGEKVVEWNGLDAHSRPVTSGIYYYRLEIGDISQSRKMILVR